VGPGGAIAARSELAYSLKMDASFFAAFPTIVVGVGGGMAVASVLPISKRAKRAAFAPLIFATMILGTRYGVLEYLGPTSNFTGNRAGQVIGVLMGLIAVWLVFFRERRTREGQIGSS